MAMADKTIAAAEKWIGYLEKRSNAQLSELTANAGDGNYTIFAKQYKDRWGEDYQGQPWSAIFVSDMLYEGCGKEIVQHFAYCPYGVNWFKQHGQWHTSSPQRGNVIFFKNSQSAASHVGLVSSVGSATVVTIEGNTSSEAGVVANGGCVRKKSYSLNYSSILGYGRPAYEDVPSESEVQSDMTKTEVETIVNESLQSVKVDLQAIKNSTQELDTEMQNLRNTVTTETISAYDKANPLYISFGQVPEWWQEEVREMMQCGAIKGDGKHEICIRHDALQAAVVAYRAAVSMLGQ